MTSIFQISNPFPSTLNPPPPPSSSSSFTKGNKLLLATRAASVDGNESKPVQTEAEEKEPSAMAEQSADQSFESRLANVRLKYRSGTGKKAEKRRSKKMGGSGSTASKKSSTVMLPPVPLKEPVNARGLKVDVGFTPYSEIVNGRLAALGSAALVLVELASGKGLLSYHPPPVLFLQVYTVAAAAALFIKFEKERISIWPEKSPVTPSESSE